MDREIDMGMGHGISRESFSKKFFFEKKGPARTKEGKHLAVFRAESETDFLRTGPVLGFENFSDRFRIDKEKDVGMVYGISRDSFSKKLFSRKRSGQN